MAKIYVTMEGGLVQGVSSDDPALVGVEYVVIDYDTENSDDEYALVRQSDGTTSEAYLGGGTVDALEVEILDDGEEDDEDAHVGETPIEDEVGRESDV